MYFKELWDRILWLKKISYPGTWCLIIRNAVISALSYQLFLKFSLKVLPYLNKTLKNPFTIGDFLSSIRLIRILEVNFHKNMKQKSWKDLPPHWRSTRRHLEFSEVAAAWRGVRPHESWPSKCLRWSPFNRSSNSSALSHSAAWGLNKENIPEMKQWYLVVILNDTAYFWFLLLISVLGTSSSWYCSIPGRMSLMPKM